MSNAHELSIDDLCAVVVTYYPDTGIADRISRVASQVSKVVVVNNGSEFELPSDIEVISNKCNRGIAAALNQGLNWARTRHYSWALLLDQDTICGPEMVKRLKAAYLDHPEREKLAIIGSNHGAEYEPHCKDSLWSEAKFVITSGTLISLKSADRIGRFREEFFIDCVDFEYCLRARRLGFHVIQLNSQVMDHFIGTVTHHRLLGRPTATTNHSSWRWYYQTRNSLVLCREYLFVDPIWSSWLLLSRLKRTILMILFESSRLAKLKTSLLAVRDFALGTYSHAPFTLNDHRPE